MNRKGMRGGGKGSGSGHPGATHIHTHTHTPFQPSFFLSHPFFSFSLSHTLTFPSHPFLSLHSIPHPSLSSLTSLRLSIFSQHPSALHSPSSVSHFFLPSFQLSSFFLPACHPNTQSSSVTSFSLSLSPRNLMFLTPSRPR